MRLIKAVLIAGICGCLVAIIFLLLTKPKQISADIKVQPKPQPIQLSTDPKILKLTETVNKYRKIDDKPPLLPALYLRDLTEKRACEIAQKTKANHDILDHYDVKEFIFSNTDKFKIGKVGENLTEYIPEDKIVTAWYLSYKHRENMLSDEFHYTWFSNCGSDVWVQLMN